MFWGYHLKLRTVKYRKTSNCLDPSAKYPGVFGKNLSSPLLFSRARNKVFQILFARWWNRRWSARPREIARDRRESTRHSLLQVRCSGASLRSRGRRVGEERRSLGYHAVEESIPTRVRIGSVMIPKWKRSKRRWPRRSERGRTQAVDLEFERSSARQLSTCELLQSVAMTGYRH